MLDSIFCLSMQLVPHRFYLVTGVSGGVCVCASKEINTMQAKLDALYNSLAACESFDAYEDVANAIAELETEMHECGIIPALRDGTN